MRQVRPIPPRLLPHVDKLKIERTQGAGADGRSYATPELPKRALIVDGSALVNGRYDPQSVANGTVYVETKDLVGTPNPESKVTIWVGTEYQRVAYVESWSRYFDPQIGDLLEIRLR